MSPEDSEGAQRPSGAHQAWQSIAYALPPRQVDRLLVKARQDPRILAVLLFGSVARGEETVRSDIDVCLVLPANRYTPLEISPIKLDYSRGG